MLKAILISVIGLSSLDSSAATLYSLADSTRTTYPSQLIKVGLLDIRPVSVAATYERQLSPRFAVLGSIGYWNVSFESSNTYYDQADILIEDHSNWRQRTFTTDAQLRYYFRRHRPHRALGGWYTALNLHGSYQASWERHTRYVEQNRDETRLNVQPQLVLGRQWSFGKHLVADTFTGMNIYRRSSANRPNPRAYRGGLNWGLQVGWRIK
ncbi:hypothetical protein [Hymenobacter sp. GOD-10R]|uniref:hypothetical protein n=1 Tax=Hymenobacter sp. GOD-10R TaxID=3093922 RepID=UPI002D77D936|nr:hypothetical protein [Hymenobacter sp. GOD-10R]WRQ30364.1 hypothetical protein SD425_08835 [Hymenobacter sp. GOD-10R]